MLITICLATPICCCGVYMQNSNISDKQYRFYYSWSTADMLTVITERFCKILDKNFTKLGLFLWRLIGLPWFTCEAETERSGYLIQYF